MRPRHGSTDVEALRVIDAQLSDELEGPLVLDAFGDRALENVRAKALRHPDERLDALVAEIEGHLPPPDLGSDHIGFAVPLRLRCDEGELRLMTTLTSFATALDVTLAELHLGGS